MLGGLVLLGAEMLIPGAFLLWIGLAAIAAGGVIQLLAPPFWQVALVFLVTMSAGIAFALRVRQRRPVADVNTPGSGLVGRTGLVLPGEGPELRVRLGDSEWPARMARDAAAAAGLRVRVEAVDGNMLVVRPDA
jgi:membrane protein implicated in regulation of membrane protease activity